MGQNISVSNDINIITSHITKIDGGVSENKLMKQVRNSTKLSPRKQIMMLSTDSEPSYRNIDKVALIFCNSYYGTRYDLGDCAINDGLLCYDKFKSYSYDTYLYYDITAEKFKELLINNVCLNCNKMVIYFIGHGTQIRDKKNEENDGLNECFVFKDKYVIDDEVAEIINTNNHCQKLTLIADCCHSGTIYDIPSRNDIITISACNDSQTAKQDWINHKGNGVFSYYFWKYLPECNNKGKLLKEKMNDKLKKYSQSCVFNYLTDEVL